MPSMPIVLKQPSMIIYHKKTIIWFFDLEKLSYISSAGIRVFLLLINKLEASKKKIGITILMKC
jgi:anti-anti-sigma regulatory factor